MDVCNSLYDELRHYGKFLSEIELSECCHQKFFKYNDKIYSVTMRNGEVLVVCEVNYYNYSVEALSNKRGDI